MAKRIPSLSPPVPPKRPDGIPNSTTVATGTGRRPAIDLMSVDHVLVKGGFGEEGRRPASFLGVSLRFTRQGDLGTEE